MNTPEDDKLIQEAGRETVDALRGALGDNPCILADKTDDVYHLSDPDLARAFLVALKKHQETPDKARKGQG